MTATVSDDRRVALDVGEMLDEIEQRCGPQFEIRLVRGQRQVTQHPRKPLIFWEWKCRLRYVATFSDGQRSTEARSNMKGTLLAALTELLEQVEWNEQHDAVHPKGHTRPGTDLGLVEQ